MKQVTQVQLEKHAREAARLERVRAMGGDPTAPDIPLMVKPITGNDIFRPQTPSLATVLQAEDDGFHSDIPTNSSTPPHSLPHFMLSHSIEDDDFPVDFTEPDSIEHPPLPPQPPEFPEYPSVETSDLDEDESEGQVQHETNLDEFMDLEFLQQGEYRTLCRLLLD